MINYFLLECEISYKGMGHVIIKTFYMVSAETITDAVNAIERELDKEDKCLISYSNRTIL